MPDLTSTEIAVRIEDLYGAPLTDLEVHARDQPPGMLAALLGSLTDLQLAERNIDFQMTRLRELTGPERVIGSFEAGHLLDCARRITASVAARDAHSKATTAVLQSLHRVSAPQGQAPAHERAPTPPPAVPTPAVPSAPSR
ncbi:hypothetical protein [Streptomyces sp. NPDC059943]|uniref:hypothetical protein n=1 Tax=Streptomyces sp. NPDC059943 TaxID=3347010 RepID=UPI0036590714